MDADMTVQIDREAVAAPLVEPGPPLTPEERARYARQLALPEIGEVGQRRLGAARVLVVGAGGLGSPVLMALAGAGIGTIGIVDDDVVAVSNLHRQTIHAGSPEGESKVASAARALAALNPLVRVVPVRERIDAASAERLLADWDVIVDGSDTFATQAVVADAAAAHGIPLVWGSAIGLDGQVGVFDRDGVGFGDLYPTVPADEPGGTCRVAGVLGPVCGAVGSVMAMEAIKLIVGAGRPLRGRMLVLDALDQTWREVAIRRG